MRRTRHDRPASERYTVDDCCSRTPTRRVMEQPRLGDIAVHWHDFYELCLVLDGEAAHVVNGVPSRPDRRVGVPAVPGRLPRAPTRRCEALSCFNAVIDAGGRAGPGRARAGRGGRVPAPRRRLRRSAPDFARLQQESEASALGSAQVAEALATCLLVELAQAGRRTAIRPPRPPPTATASLRRAVLYVDRHFREPLTLADVAAQAHLSPNYFSERFRALTGMLVPDLSAEPAAPLRPVAARLDAISASPRSATRRASTASRTSAAPIGGVTGGRRRRGTAVAASQRPAEPVWTVHADVTFRSRFRRGSLDRASRRR